MRVDTLGKWFHNAVPGTMDSLQPLPASASVEHPTKLEDPRAEADSRSFNTIVFGRICRGGLAIACVD